MSADVQRFFEEQGYLIVEDLSAAASYLVGSEELAARPGPETEAGELPATGASREP